MGKHKGATMQEAGSLAEAVVTCYDRLNPHHSDSVDKSKGYHDLLELVPLTAGQIATIQAGITHTMSEADGRNGAFSSRLVQQLEQTLKMLRAKRPASGPA